MCSGREKIIGWEKGVAKERSGPGVRDDGVEKGKRGVGKMRERMVGARRASERGNMRKRG